MNTNGTLNGTSNGHINGKPKPAPDDRGSEAKKKFTKNPTARYRPSGGNWWGYPSAAIDNSPYFTWFDIPRMLRDPQVRFVERMWRAPFQQVKHVCKSESPRVKAFVEATVKRFWSRSLPKILSRYFRYGYAPGGAELRYDKRTKLVRLDRVKAIEPPDAQPREFARGRRQGEYAGFSLSGTGGGAEVCAPHALWFAGHGEFGPYYDFPVIAGMFEPWLEKRGRNGAIQSRRTWFRTASFRGAVLRYPEGRGDITEENPEGRDNQDIANETLDALEAGSRLAISNELHAGTDKPKWDVDWAQGQPDVAGLRDYPQDLDREMLVGAGIPPEVLEASEVGSGWSGRMIPLLAFFGGVDELAGLITEVFDRDVLRYLVRLNFGEAWYELEPQSLAAEIKKSATSGAGGSEGANPLAGLFGGKSGEQGAKGGAEEKGPLALSDARAALGAKELPQDPILAAVESLADRVRELSAAFEEGKHPRDHGKFAAKPGESGTAATAPVNSPHPDQAAHVADAVAGLKVEVPELADPTVWGKVGDRVTTAAAKVYMRMVRATPAALRVIDLAKDVLDTPDDVRRWGGMYNAEAGTAGPKVPDHVKDATGISTHLALSVGSKLLARALAYAKKKLAKGEAGGNEMSVPPDDAFTEAGEILAGVLGDLAAELGLPIEGAAGAITAALRAAGEAAAKQLSRPALDAAHDPQGAAQKIGRYTKREIVGAIVSAMATAQLRATARGKPEAAADHLDALAELSQDEGAIESIAGGKDLSWTPFEGPRGGRGWKNTETGRVVYGGDQPGEKRAKRQASAEEAHKALAEIDKDGGTKEHMEALAEHFPALTVQQLLAVRRKYGAAAGGKRRHADLVHLLLGHVREKVVADRAAAAGKKPPKLEPKVEVDSNGNPRKPEQPAAGSERPGGSGTDGAAGGGGGGVAQAAGGTGDGGLGEKRPTDGQSAGAKPADRVPAEIHRVNARLDRLTNLFRAKGQHKAADWMTQLRDHVNAVGPAAALQSLGDDRGAGDGGVTQYAGVDADSPNWGADGNFVEEYLARHGIVPATDDFDAPIVSSQTNRDPWGGDVPRAGDMQPQETPYDTKLDEAKDLPGLESSEDIAKIVGKPVTHFTPEVTAKLDEKYGAGRWIVKTYGDHAFAGQGIYFPQRINQISQDARNTLWSAGENLAKYGFSIARDKSGKAIGIQHEGGDRYDFGTKKYKDTIHGDARHWGDRAADAAQHEHGTALAFGGKDFMAQPAFPVVGVTEEQRARGVTHEGTGEGRTHVLTRQDGSVELIPHSTWIKGEPLPVVFEDEDTKAMAAAAHDAISKLPAKARTGQVYAPDIVKTKDGYRVVELNASVEYGGSGYLSDNPLVIDAYVSHLTGRTPAHVRFIRKVLSGRAKEKPEVSPAKVTPQPKSFADRLNSEAKGGRELSWVPDFSSGVFAWRNAESGELVPAADETDQLGA